MRTACGLMLATAVLTATLGVSAQPPGGPKGKKDGPKASAPVDPAASAARLMAFDKNGDGKLTKAELADERLTPLFDRADANKDGAVTKDELVAVFTTAAAAAPRGGPGERPPPPKK